MRGIDPREEETEAGGDLKGYGKLVKIPSPNFGVLPKGNNIPLHLSGSEKGKN